MSKTGIGFLGPGSPVRFEGSFFRNAASVVPIGSGNGSNGAGGKAKELMIIGSGRTQTDSGSQPDPNTPTGWTRIGFIKASQNIFPHTFHFSACAHAKILTGAETSSITPWTGGTTGWCLRFSGVRQFLPFNVQTMAQGETRTIDTSETGPPSLVIAFGAPNCSNFFEFGDGSVAPDMLFDNNPTPSNAASHLAAFKLLKSTNEAIKISASYSARGPMVVANLFLGVVE